MSRRKQQGARAAELPFGKRARTRKLFGKYIVADPKICHGKLTFLGTRIFVRDVLEMVASGMPWSKIVKECHGGVTEEAISEAVLLAGRAFIEHADEYSLEPIPS
jgi:uncharacterized protein (DUF433 family)